MNRHATQTKNRPARTTSDGTRRRLRDTIARDLTSDDRLIVVLRYAERMTFREIALVLGMTTEQVEHRLVRLEERLRAVA